LCTHVCFSGVLVTVVHQQQCPRHTDAPPHPAFGGAALISSTGKLLGMGSLIVPNAAGPEQQVLGNMFIPVDWLKPILGGISGQRQNIRAAPAMAGT